MRPTLKQDAAEHFTGHGKGKSNVAEGPEIAKQNSQAEKQQDQSASSVPLRHLLQRHTRDADLGRVRLKQDLPTDLLDSGTGKSEHHTLQKSSDKMARWLEQTPQEEPWSAAGYYSRDHSGSE